MKNVRVNSRRLSLALVTLCFTFSGVSRTAFALQRASKTSADDAKAIKSYGKLPLSFEANQGQADPQVRYLARGAGYSLSLTESGALFAFYDSGPDGQAADSIKPLPLTRLERLRDAPAKRLAEKSQVSILRMQLDGARTDAPISGEAPLQGTANYFVGNDPARWRTGIPTYGKVRYSGVYPGVDLVYYGTGQQLEFDFVVTPSADPNRIRMHFDGAGGLALDSHGDLVIRGGGNDIHFHKPAIYQQVGERRLPVDGGFEISRDNTVHFRLGSYDSERPLIIDPVLAYSTYLEGGWVTGMAVDEKGEVVISGVGFGPIQTTPGAFETKDPITVEGNPVYVAKLNAEGTGLIFATYLQGKVAEDTLSWAYGVGVDGEGNVYVAGQTDLNDFPTTKGAFMPTRPDAQTTGFVSKLSADGTKLLYSTFLGGSKPADPGQPGGNDVLYGMTVDAAGHAYVTGTTWSTDFPTTPGAYQRKMKPGNIRNSCTASKLKLDGSGLDYATYLGGSQEDQCQAIGIDSEGNATVGGFTNSDDYPTTAGAIPRKVTGLSGDGMVSKLNADGTKLLYSTYLGGSSGLDNVVRIADDPAGNVYVLGGTDSTDFPTTSGAFQKHMNAGIGAFVVKFASEHMTLSYATYLGEFLMMPYGIAADSSGNAYITGDTAWARFPVTQGAFLTVPYEMGAKGDEGLGAAAFLVELNRTGSALRYSTFLGGSQGGECGCAKAVAIGPDGDVYLSGRTYSPDFPVTPGAYTTTLADGRVEPLIGGGRGGTSYAPYVMKLNAEYAKTLPATTITISSSNNPQKAGISVTFTARVKSTVKGGSVPTGLVGFQLWGVLWETVSLDSKGIAKFTATPSQLVPGLQHMIVMYLGDDTHAPSNAIMAETIE